MDLLFFWKGVFSQSGPPDPRSVQQPLRCQSSVLDPNTAGEIDQIPKEMRYTAPGVNRLIPADMVNLGAETVAQPIIVPLALRISTRHLDKTRIKLTPKCRNANMPGEFRPISFTSVLMRLLHKILARCWGRPLSLSSWQMTFRCCQCYYPLSP